MKKILYVLMGAALLVGLMSPIIAQVQNYTEFDWVKIRKSINLPVGAYFEAVRIGTGATFGNIGTVTADELGVEGNVEIDGTLYQDGETVHAADVRITGGFDLWLVDSAAADSIRIYSDTTYAYFDSENPYRIQVGSSTILDISSTALLLGEEITLSVDSADVILLLGSDLYIEDASGADSLLIHNDGSNSIFESDNTILINAATVTGVTVASTGVTLGTSNTVLISDVLNLPLHTLAVGDSVLGNLYLNVSDSTLVAWMPDTSGTLGWQKLNGGNW